MSDAKYRDDYAAGWNTVIYGFGGDNDSEYAANIRKALDGNSKLGAAYRKGGLAALDAFGRGEPLERMRRLTLDELNR